MPTRSAADPRTESSPRRGTRRAVVLLGVVALAALTVHLWPRRHEPPRDVASDAPSTEAAAEPGQRVLGRTAPGGPRDPWPSPEPDVGVVIDGVDVDRSEICKGEEVVVTVRGRSTDRDGARFISYGVLGRSDLVGPRFTLHPEESVGYGEMQIALRGRRGFAKAVAVPPVVVKDCEAPDAIVLEQSRRAAMMDRPTLTARLIERGREASARPFQAFEYVWSFGDGSTETTSGPTIEHSYEARRQDANYSYFFATVEAHDRDGRAVRGSRSLRFVNLGFRPSLEGKVTVFSGIDEHAAGGEKIWLYHGHDEVVTIDRVVIKDVAIAGDGREQTTGVRGGDPLAVLGFASIPPGQSVVTRDLASLRPSGGVAMRLVEVEGRTPTGRVASGAFNLLPVPQAVAASLDEGKESQP
jgi:hypothetical protein